MRCGYVTDAATVVLIDASAMNERLLGALSCLVLQQASLAQRVGDVLSERQRVNHVGLLEQTAKDDVLRYSHCFGLHANRPPRPRMTMKHRRDKTNGT